MLTSVAVMFAAVGFCAMHEFRCRYDRDGSAWWQLLTAAAVTTGLVIQSLALNRRP